MQIKLSNLAKELMSSGLKDPANKEQLASFIPFQGTPASAGYDLRACIDEPKKIALGETLLVPCGFHLHIKDPNVVGKLYVRSSVGTELGLVLANGTGIVDSDYQDEWMLALRCYRCENLWTILQELVSGIFNSYTGLETLSNVIRQVIRTTYNNHVAVNGVTIYPAQRLAQVVFTPVVHPMFYHVEEFTNGSDRFGGFGSTDKLATDGKTYGG